MLLVDDLAAGGTKNLRHTPRGLVTLLLSGDVICMRFSDSMTVIVIVVQLFTATGGHGGWTHFGVHLVVND